MIIDIPSKNDFTEQAIAFLNLAWDTVFDLLLEYSDAEEWDAIVDNEQTEDYWKAAQKPLATAVALSQQGAELLLKGNIAEISPFILISGKPSEWPSKCHKQDISYSSFHTADAQDLVRINDTVAKKRLSEKFKQLFNKLRLTRNTIFHTVDQTIQFTEKEVILAILEITEELIGQQQWTAIRRAYLESTPSSAVWSYDTVALRISREMLLSIDLLGNNDLKMLLWFNKKQRRYICPNCTGECRWVHSELQPQTAQLSPNKPSSNNIYCFVCRKNIKVVRMKCNTPNCKGNVIHADIDFECLTCFEPQQVDE
jgi:hypothetical protein